MRFATSLPAILSFPTNGSGRHVGLKPDLQAVEWPLLTRVTAVQPRRTRFANSFYAIGRDGLVSLIDLWTSVPTTVATVKGYHDARSVDGSKFTGYEDKYLIEDCYWPPQYVVFDGLTLEPLARVDLPMQSITGETLLENRVASIVASPFEPSWVISLKESSYVGVVEYAQAGFPPRATIATERFLHDGG